MSTLRPERTAGWPGYIVWAICGAMWSFSFLSFVGPFMWPLAIGLTWLAFRYTPARRDALGLVAGVGAFLRSSGSCM